MIFGSASTLVTVPQMPDMQAEAIALLPDLTAPAAKRRTNLVSATFTTFQNAGGFMGPLLGGVVTTRYGVSTSLMGTGVVYLCWGSLLVGHSLLRPSGGKVVAAEAGETVYFQVASQEAPDE
jgi:predicted MFS family arabinose efflux permease